MKDLEACKKNAAVSASTEFACANSLSGTALSSTEFGYPNSLIEMALPLQATDLLQQIPLVRGLPPLIPRHERRVIMRKRNNRIVFYLNDKELATLDRKVKKAGRSREAFIRNAVADIQIKEAPPADLHKLIWEIRRVGNNIDQILMIANSKGILNIPDLRKAIDDLREVEKLIVSQYI